MKIGAGQIGATQVDLSMTFAATSGTTDRAALAQQRDLCLVRHLIA
jgi:hypothetical protein